MKKILKLEELFMTAGAIYLLTLNKLNLSAWIWCLLFFAPDLSMLGYVINEKVGAACYNLVHHKGVAIACAAIGIYLKQDILLSTGILLFAHSSFDRIFGYGLKYNTGFNYTHLGNIKK